MSSAVPDYQIDRVGSLPRINTVGVCRKVFNKLQAHVPCAHHSGLVAAGRPAESCFEVFAVICLLMLFVYVNALYFTGLARGTQLETKFFKDGNISDRHETLTSDTQLTLYG
eukprot:2087344-Amphidinium_carterae.1